MERIWVVKGGGSLSRNFEKYWWYKVLKGVFHWLEGSLPFLYSMGLSYAELSLEKTFWGTRMQKGAESGIAEGGVTVPQKFSTHLGPSFKILILWKR